MRDFFIGWHEKFQPLGPALKTPRIEVDAKSAIAEFEERSFDHPSCTGGNAPSLSPQALVPSPAAQMEFRVGEWVLYEGDHTGPWIGIVLETKVDFDGSTKWTRVADKNEPTRIGLCDTRYLKHIDPSQPSDTQQWVEWKGGECPVPQGTRIEVRRL